MSSSVYKVRFNKSSFDLSEEYDKLSDYEKERMSELEAESFFDFNDDSDNYICYFITTPLEIEIYKNILDNNLINILVEDLSEKIIRNRVNLEDDLKAQLNSGNSIKYSFFIDDINDWIYNNIDMDIILDRISESGISSLRNIEKQFLNNYNK